MKKLLIATALILAVLVGCKSADAWTLSWEAVTYADGYRVSYKPLAATDYIGVDVGANISIDLDALSLVVGTRYEMFVQAFANTTGGGIAWSGESDHLRWTYPSPPSIIEYMPAPQKPVINP